MKLELLNDHKYKRTQKFSILLASFCSWVDALHLQKYLLSVQNPREKPAKHYKTNGIPQRTVEVTKDGMKKLPIEPVGKGDSFIALFHWNYSKGNGKNL